MANVSYLRTPVRQQRSAARLHRRLTVTRRRRRGPALRAAAAVLVLAVIGLGLIAVVSSSASLSADSRALASANMPLGGGTITQAFVSESPDNQPIPITIKDNRIWPRRLIPAGSRVLVEVIVKRSGIVSWLTGSTERLRLELTAPTASLATPYLTLPSGAPLRVRFNQPVQQVSYGQTGALHRQLLASPQQMVELPRTGPSGSEFVAAAPRIWESAHAAAVSWFPAGSHLASAVANPAPGSRIEPSTPITLTLSQPVQQALGSHLPPVSPNTPGMWHTAGDHTIIFQPEGYGYGLGATVTVPLPSGVQLVGAQQGGSVAAWTVAGGSTLRLQQLLSILGYLPVNFHYQNGTGVGLTAQAQEQAAVSPPAGTFDWRWGDIPGQLRSRWQPGAAGTVTRGALMAFENDHNMTPDGVAGPGVWRALIAAAISGRRSTFGYTFVSVDQHSETLTLWHSGRTVLTTPVNTGVAGAPTANGLFPVFEHIASGTMSGTNPDGSHYSDPGIPWISYFNGGDALHGFVRGSYGTPQSDGCVEMPIPTSAKVWSYTPIGALVDVT